MKKTYETPKAEKLEFDYTDTILASGESIDPGEEEFSTCSYGTFSQQQEGCNSDWVTQITGQM